MSIPGEKNIIMHYDYCHWPFGKLSHENDQIQRMEFNQWCIANNHIWLSIRLKIRAEKKCGDTKKLDEIECIFKFLIRR